MNPGPVEEAGKVATSFIGSFRDSPALLAVSVFYILFLGAVLWSTVEERAWRENLVKMMVEQQTESAKLLFSCVPYDQVSKFLEATKNWRP